MDGYAVIRHLVFGQRLATRQDLCWQRYRLPVVWYSASAGASMTRITAVSRQQIPQGREVGRRQHRKTWQAYQWTKQRVASGLLPSTEWQVAGFYLPSRILFVLLSSVEREL